jgi:hypothetical protein
MLKDAGYRLQANVKTNEGMQHADREDQFRYLKRAGACLSRRRAAGGVSGRQEEELIGEFKNVGREWEPAGRPQEVRDHDFMLAELGKAFAYGVYDVERNVGWVNVGQDHETATFAVESLRRWWRGDGTLAYPQSDRLLICCDGGGSNGNRVRLWKYELSRLAAEAGLAIADTCKGMYWLAPEKEPLQTFLGSRRSTVPGQR